MNDVVLSKSRNEKHLLQNDSTEEKKEAAEKTKRPSMIPYDPSSPTSATTQLLGLSDEILKTLRDPKVGEIKIFALKCHFGLIKPLLNVRLKC